MSADETVVVSSDETRNEVVLATPFQRMIIEFVKLAPRTPMVATVCVPGIALDGSSLLIDIVGGGAAAVTVNGSEALAPVPGVNTVIATVRGDTTSVASSSVRSS